VCTIQVWRSYWVILDKYLYPNEEDHIYSAIICLASGVFIYIIIYCFKDLLNRHLCKKSQEQEAGFYKKEIILRVIVLINFIAVVNIWRGLWMLQMLAVKTFVSKNSTKSIICLLSICLGLVCLLIFHRISAILSRGNCKDEIFFMEKKYIVVETVSTTFLSKEVR
jgi:Fuseless